MRFRGISRIFSMLALTCLIFALFVNVSEAENLETSQLERANNVELDQDVTTSYVDKIKPEFNSVSINKTQISPSSSVVISVEATDDSDSILDVFAYYQMPGSNDLRTVRLNKNNSGKYEGSFQITNETELGVWKLKYIYLGDNSFNSTYIYNQNIFISPNDKCLDLSYCDFEVIKPTGADSNPPEYKSISVDKNLVLIGDSVTITVDAVDYESTAFYVDVYLKKPITNDIEKIRLTKNDDGKYSGTIDISDGFELGLWKISYIVLEDTLGNSKTIYDGYYDSNHRYFYPSYFTVVDKIVPVTAITLDKTDVRVKLGEDFQLNASVWPENATNKTITWKSNDNSIAYADYSGKVETHKTGTTTILATTQDGLKVASCTVTVYDPMQPVYATDVIMSESEITLEVGEECTINATLIPENASNKLIKWTSDNEEFVTVQNGKVTAHKPGIATIRAISGDNFARNLCYVTVIDKIVNVENIVMDNNNMDVVTGLSFGLGITILPENATDKKVIWSSDNEDVAKVDEYGIITTLKSGVANITAKTRDGSKTAICKINVSNPENDNGAIDVFYETHVQNLGWQGKKVGGELSGTYGMSYRLEGIKINIDNKGSDVGVEYQTHVENIGWQDLKRNGELSGTSGKSLRLEAIKINLSGNDADKYDIYYTVHAQNFGWLDWAKNGESAGTEGFGYRLECLRIVVLPKGSEAPGKTGLPFIKKE